VLSLYTLQSFLVPLASGSVVGVGREVQGAQVTGGKSLKSMYVVGSVGIQREVVGPPVTAAYAGYALIFPTGNTPCVLSSVELKRSFHSQRRVKAGKEVS
jgi:hypothetical protein